MTTQLAFHKTTFTPICHNNRIWLTATEVGLALEYADDKAVQRIYSRHSDEFTDMMTRVVKVTTPRGMQESRVFSLRGAHLIAMFAQRIPPLGSGYSRSRSSTIPNHKTIH